MDKGSSSEAVGKSRRQRRGGQQAPELPKIEPSVPQRGYSPEERKSWAQRTGFVSTFSPEISNVSVSDVSVQNVRDLEKGLEGRGNLNSPKIELDPILGRTRGNVVENGRGFEIEPEIERRKVGNGKDGKFEGENKKREIGAELKMGAREGDRGLAVGREEEKDDTEFVGATEVNGSPSGGETDLMEMQNSSWVKCGIRDNPGFGE